MTAECIEEHLRDALGPNLPTSFRFDSLVAGSFISRDANHFSNFAKRGFVCFQLRMTKFVIEIMKLPKFAAALKKLREFVEMIRKKHSLTEEFERCQKTKNLNVHLPTVKDGSWESITIFLNKCLVLRAVLKTIHFQVSKSRRFPLEEPFVVLARIYSLLEQCLKYSRKLSWSYSLISQVPQVVMSLRNFISGQFFGGEIDKPLRQAFSLSFQDFTTEPTNRMYDIACFLDPRFAYREDIYPIGIWRQIRKKVMEEYMLSSESLEDVKIEQRMSIITVEIDKYKEMITIERPAENVDPIEWWADKSIENLANVARKILITPAVAIDSNYFFGPEGKFAHLCKTYTAPQLKKYLEIAGYQQEFHGRCFYMEEPFLLKPEVAISPPTKTIFSKDRLSSGSSQVEYKMSDLLNEAKPDSLIETTSQILPTVPVHNATDLETLNPHDLYDQVVKQEPPEEEEDAVNLAFVNPRKRPNEIENEKVCRIKALRTSEDSVGFHLRADAGPSHQIVTGVQQLPIMKQPSSERCMICKLGESRPYMKTVQHDPDKLLLLVGAVYRKEILGTIASSFFHDNKLRVSCRLHYTEACDDILNILGVEVPSQVESLPDETILKLQGSVSEVSRQSIDATFLRQIVDSFLTIYYSKRKSVQYGKRIITCCYCSRKVICRDAIKLPKKIEGRVRFEKKLNLADDNQICRMHFPSDAFSSRGRFIRGIMPKMDGYQNLI